MVSDGRALRGFLGRFLLVAPVVVVLTLTLGPPFAKALMPLFKLEIASLDDALRIDALSVSRDGPEQIVLLEVGLARPVTLNGHTFTPDPRGKAISSTLLANLTLPCALLSTLVLAWPAPARRAYLLRLLLLVPAGLTLALLGAPIILLAGIHRLMLEVAAPGSSSALLLWSDFLQTGGALALALALGCLVSLTSNAAAMTLQRATS
jgi:hypothetical protein